MALAAVAFVCVAVRGPRDVSPEMDTAVDDTHMERVLEPAFAE